MKIAANLTSIRSWIRSVFLYSLDSAALTLFRKKNFATTNRLFLVRLDAIGDYILWRNAAQRLLEDYSNRGYEIVLLANSTWGELAKKDLPPHILWEVDVKQLGINPFYRVRLARKIANGNFNVAINPAYSRSFLLSDSAIRLSSAETRIGSEGDQLSIIPSLKKISNRWYTRIIPAAQNSMMELTRNVEFMRGMGYVDFSAMKPELSARTIEQPEQLTGKNYIVVFPGASWAGRQWPVSRFADIATKIYEETGLIPAICGSSADASLARAICDNSDAPIIDLTGKTSLFQLIGAIKYAKAVVTNETSAVHIAAAVHTPSVCILGGGHFGRFMPYKVDLQNSKHLPIPIFQAMSCFNCDWDCPYIESKKDQNQPAPCIESITLESVYNQLVNCIDSTVLEVPTLLRVEAQK